MRTHLLVCFGAAALAACSPYAPDLGGAPFLCGAGSDNAPRCPDGYTCMSNGSGQDVCVAPNSLPPDADMSACNVDMNLEPNDTIQQATQTPVEVTKSSIPYAGLAICPATDKDTFAITIQNNLDNLELIVQYDTGAPLQASILSSSGTPLANGSPDGANTLHAFVPNLPVGMYYAQVYGSGSGTNTYKMTIAACTTTTSPNSCTM
jgi:hypothetical protein